MPSQVNRFAPTRHAARIQRGVPPVYKTVLFLGAGASVPFGLPVTREILPRIRKRLRSGKLFDQHLAERDSKVLRDFLAAFLPGLKNIRTSETAKHPLITDVLSLVDHLLASEVSARPSSSTIDLSEVRRVMELAVLRSLFNRKEPPNARLLSDLAGWVATCRARTGRPTAIISTNYDTLLEMKIYAELQELHPKDKEDWTLLGHRWVDFGFNWRNVYTGEVLLRPDDPDVGIFKLHGSLNWLACPMCGYIYVNRRYNIYRIVSDSGPIDDQRCHCDFTPMRTVIVAPSMVRSIRDPNLLSVWQGALEALRTADEWIIAGYSLPPEDLAIRSILLRARFGRRTPPSVRVILGARAPLDKDTTVRNRYELLFPDCDIGEIGFESFIGGLAGPAYGGQTGSA
jgi:NAD-dependent SIR2 family protein deacetylase